MHMASKSAGGRPERSSSDPHPPLPSSEGYVWWVNDGKPAWWIASSAMKPVPEADVGQRPVPYEPMYLIVNLGLSENFGAIESVSREANYRSACRADAHPCYVAATRV